jgi:hypothetical protein
VSRILDSKGQPVSRETEGEVIPIGGAAIAPKEPMPEASQLDTPEPEEPETTAHGLPDDDRGKAIEAAFAKLQRVELLNGSSVAAITRAAYRAFHRGKLSGVELQLLGGKPPMRKQSRH